jgi:hypothetical protein
MANWSVKSEAMRFANIPLLAAALLAGCSNSATRYPVEGQVLAGTQPVAEAMVVFHPRFETPPGDPKPLGITNSEGKFQLTSLQSNDGALPGDYRITIELRQERTSGEELVRDGPNLLPPRYARPDSTPFQFKVGSGQNVAPPLIIEQ